MSVTFIYQKINRSTRQLEERFEFSNDAVLRAYLRLQVRDYVKDNDEHQERLDTFLNCTYEEQHRQAIDELAPSEAVVVPHGYYTDTHVYVVNVFLQRTGDDLHSEDFLQGLEENVDVQKLIKNKLNEILYKGAI